MAATPDLSRILDVEERKKAADLFLALQAAEDAIEAASDAISEEATAVYDAKRAAMDAEYEAKIAALDAEFDAAHGLDALRKARDAAEEAYAPYDGDSPLRLRRDHYNDDGIARCALSGLPLWVSDDVLVGGRAEILRAVVLDYGQRRFTPPFEPDDGDEFDVSEEDDEEAEPARVVAVA